MKILICSDGRAAAERAVRFIRRAAAACAAEVTLLGIIEHRRDENALNEALRGSADLLREKGLAVETVTRDGQPVDEIQRRTCAERYDFVLIGTERKGGGPFALSEKAYRLIKEIEPPVMVLAGERPELRKALVCSSGFIGLDKAVELTADLAGKARLDVTLLHVMAEPPAIYSGLLHDEIDADRLLASNSLLARSLRRQLGVLGARGVSARLVLRNGIVGPEILREIESGAYDLAVAGSAPAHGTLHRYVMGNVASEIVNSARCAVLIVRGEAARVPGGFWDRLGGWFRK